MSLIKQSSSLKWNYHNKGNKNSNKPNWIHQPEALKNGHVAYLIKFLGNTEVDQPKGIEVVKEGIRKLKFSQHLKRAEGAKTPKVELTISIDGVAIQEPKTKRISYQYPLHRISYCADDKTDPKFFSFIAKEADCDKHNCFVFVSDKLAEEITLTIGQAFDLAYRRFLETSGRDLEMQKKLMVLQKRVQELEAENVQLKTQLSNYENKMKSLNKSKYSSTFNGKNCNNKIPSLQPPPKNTHSRNLTHNSSLSSQRIDLMVMDSNENQSVSLDDENFNPREFDSVEKNGSSNGHFESPFLSNGNNHKIEEKDIFGCEPFNPSSSMKGSSDDLFGMGSFEAQELEQAIGAIDKKLAEMRDGFSRGLSFGNDNFSIETLHPTN